MSDYPYWGYAGRYLRVDLSSNRVRELAVPLEWIRDYLGGNGFGTRILWEEVPPSADPLGPANKLIIAPGALTGGPLPNASRTEFIAKSPLTGIYGDANAGGYLGAELKFAGYDLLVFEEQSEEPVYLYIEDDKAELRSAARLWGRSTLDTESALQQECGSQELKVACIGPAGENGVRFASINLTHRRTAARSGLGAVMGSKRLKAIAVRGTRGFSVADPAKLRELSLKLHHAIRENEFFPGVSRFGTPGLVALMNPMGRFPAYNFQKGSFEKFQSISGETLRAEHLVRDISCYGCPVACDKLYRIVKGKRAGSIVSSVEYENLNALGACIGNSDLDCALHANLLCDDLGMDAISAGRVIAFAFELYEKGIIPQEIVGDLDLRWGSRMSVLTLLQRIALREGSLGKILGEGSARAANLLGDGAARYAMHVKGQEIPAQDGRAQQSMGLAHVTSSRGADHLKAFPVIDETGYRSEAVRRYGEQYLPELIDPLATRHKAMLVKDGEDFGAVVDSCGNCKSGGTFVMAEIYWEEQARAIQASTGMKIDSSELKRIGERIYNLQRCYNALHGISSHDDVLPWRFTQVPSPSGNARGSVCGLDVMLPEYYGLRGWDPETGLPLRATLERLGLGEAYDRVKRAIECGSAGQIRKRLGWAAPWTGAARGEA